MQPPPKQESTSNTKVYKLPRRLKINNNLCYEVVDFLGKGGYAIAVSALKIVTNTTSEANEELQESTAGDSKSEDNSNKELVAIKAVMKKRTGSVTLVSTVMSYVAREIDIMKTLDHVNILKLYNHFTDDKYVYLVLELCTNKTLSHIIKNDNLCLNNSQLKCLIYQMANGCQYMHSKLVVHRDLKPENIFLNKEYTVKIADFGLAVCLTSKDQILHTFCGTPKYQAPEMINGSGYSFGVDVWALGCTAYRLFYGNAPFEGRSTDEIFKAILTKNVKYLRISKNNHTVEAEEIKVIKSLLQKDQDKRIQLDKLIQNTKFFQFQSNSLQTAEKAVESSTCTNQVMSISGGLNMKLAKMINCLEAISYYDSNKRIRLNYMPYHDFKLMPKHWIQQWIDISMYGFGYLLNQQIFAFNFNDRSKMLLNNQLISYCNSINICTNFVLDQCPEELKKKFKIMQQAQIIMVRKGGTTKLEEKSNNENDTEKPGKTLNKQSSEEDDDLPWLIKWKETLSAIVFQFTSQMIQINFHENEKVLLFDPRHNSLTIINNSKHKVLCLSLDFVLDDHVTDMMQNYISVALQYISLLNIKRSQIINK